jgi:DNA-directed RNA polymerase specialized sigma24 family protein
MASKTTGKIYEPAELKILVDALNGAPSYLSKRFILKHLCGWSDEMIAENMRMKQEEEQQMRIGEKTWR